MQALTSLEAVGQASAAKGLDFGAWWAALSLEAVGRAAAAKGFGSVAEQAADSLGAVGKAAAKKGLEPATEQTASSLAFLQLSAEDLVNLPPDSAELSSSMIPEYESRLTESDRASYQRFKDYYEANLKQFRAVRGI